jgi:hypothetical protein
VGVHTERLSVFNNARGDHCPGSTEPPPTTTTTTTTSG